MSLEKETRHCAKLLQSRSTTTTDRDALTIDPPSIMIVSHRSSSELADEDDAITVSICTPIVVGVLIGEDLSVMMAFEIQHTGDFTRIVI